MGQWGFIGIHKDGVSTTPACPHAEMVILNVSDEDHDSAAADEVFGDDVERMMDFIESIVDCIYFEF